MSTKTKLVILWSVLAVVAFVLLTPLPTMRIKVDLPAGANPGDLAAAQRSTRWFAPIFAAVVCAGLLLFGRWMHRRIVGKAS